MRKRPEEAKAEHVAIVTFVRLR